MSNGSGCTPTLRQEAEGLGESREVDGIAKEGLRARKEVGVREKRMGERRKEGDNERGAARS